MDTEGETETEGGQSLHAVCKSQQRHVGACVMPKDVCVLEEQISDVK